MDPVREEGPVYDIPERKEGFFPKDLQRFLVITTVVGLVLIGIAMTTGSMGDDSILRDVAIATGTTGSVLIVIAVAAAILHKKDKQIDEEKAEIREKASTQREEFARKTSAFSFNKGTSLIKTSDEWEELKKKDFIEEDGHKYANLTHEVDSTTQPLAPSPFVGHYALPAIGYDPITSKAVSPNMALELPREQLSKFPKSVKDAVASDERVDVYFLLYEEKEVAKPLVKEIFLQPLFPQAENEKVDVEIGIFNPAERNSNLASKDERTFSTKKESLKLGALEKKTLMQTDDLAPGKQPKIQFTPNTNVADFYLVTKTEEKTVVSHVVYVRKNEGDGKNLKNAYQNAQNVQGFVDALPTGRETTPLTQQIKKELDKSKLPKAEIFGLD